MEALLDSDAKQKLIAALPTISRLIVTVFERLWLRRYGVSGSLPNCQANAPYDGIKWVTSCKAQSVRYVNRLAQPRPLIRVAAKACRPLRWEGKWSISSCSQIRFIGLQTRIRTRGFGLRRRLTVRLTWMSRWSWWFKRLNRQETKYGLEYRTREFEPIATIPPWLSLVARPFHPCASACITWLFHFALGGELHGVWIKQHCFTELFDCCVWRYSSARMEVVERTLQLSTLHTRISLESFMRNNDKWHFRLFLRYSSFQTTEIDAWSSLYSRYCGCTVENSFWMSSSLTPRAWSHRDGSLLRLVNAHSTTIVPFNVRFLFHLQWTWRQYETTLTRIIVITRFTTLRFQSKQLFLLLGKVVESRCVTAILSFFFALSGSLERDCDEWWWLQRRMCHACKLLLDAAPLDGSL